MIVVRKSRQSPVDAVAGFAELRERVHPPVASVTLTEEQLDEMLDRRERVRAEQERAERLRQFVGGPCWGCGSTFSWVEQSYAQDGGSAAVRSEDVPGWRPAGPGRTVCYPCHEDRHFGGQVLSDSDWRGGIALDLLKAAGKEGFWTAPAVGKRLEAAGVPVFWVEHDPRPGTHTSDGGVVDRFPFVDVDRVVAALAPPQPAYGTGSPCPQCGVDDRWLHDPGGSTQIFDDRGNPVEMLVESKTWCAACQYVRPQSAAERRAEQGRGRASVVSSAHPVGPLPNLDLQLDPLHQGM